MMEIKFTVPGVLVLANYAPFASGSAESSYRSVAHSLPNGTAALGSVGDPNKEV